MKARSVKSFERIDEEMIGTYRGQWDANRIEVYKNPKTLKRLYSWVRACSDKNGNLYVANSEDTLHHELAKFLINRGILELIDWQRLRNTDTFYLAEGYDLSVVGLDNALTPEEKKMISNFSDKVIEKHPKFNFIHDRTILEE